MSDNWSRVVELSQICAEANQHAWEFISLYGGSSTPKDPKICGEHKIVVGYLYNYTEKLNDQSNLFIQASLVKTCERELAIIMPALEKRTQKMVKRGEIYKLMCSIIRDIPK